MNKAIKINFSQECFNDFEGDQATLDALVDQIQGLFNGKTTEELEQFGQLVTEDEFYNLPEDVKNKLLNAFAELENPQ